MARTFVYSFEDTVVTISHPNYGSYSAYGTGIGSVSVEYAAESTSHNTSADLAVVVNKHIRKDGSVNFEILQCSDFNNWLKKWSSYLEVSATEEFALTTITIENKSTGDRYVCTGCSHQKKPGTAFASTAGNVTWNIMAANIDDN